jgi:hypothetical protein
MDSWWVPEEDDEWSIEGQVRNFGDGNAYFTTVTILIYDVDGHVIVSGWDYVNPAYMEPGELSGFAIYLGYVPEEYGSMDMIVSWD